MYNVCVPDGSCGIQLALLYWIPPYSDWGPTFRESGLGPTFRESGFQVPFLKFRRKEHNSQLPEIL